MRAEREVHWHEGLFLQPHHLQALQRNLGDRISAERKLNWPYPYGVIDCQVSEDELQNMRVRFNSLNVVMPSGVTVVAPGNAELHSLDIREAFQASPDALTVYVGVPLWYEDRANVIDAQGTEGDWWRVKSLYIVREASVLDENTGSNPRPMLVRNVNARLVLKDGDKSDLEVLPILRIRRSTGEKDGKPEVDPDFVPPCMILKGSKTLSGRLRDFVNQLEASRTELVNQLARGGFQMDTLRGVQFEQLFRLNTLNRFCARLPALLEAPAVSPFDVHLELSEMLGLLAALKPDTDPFESVKYVHDDPALSIRALEEKIRPMLKGTYATRFLKEAFLLDEPSGAWITKLSDDDITLANDYFIGVKTKQDPIEVAKLVEDPDRFKLMPKSIVTRRVRGITLKEERHPPVQFPAEVGLLYFRLHRDQNPQVWEMIKREKEVGVTWIGQGQSDFAITLYMTVPEVKK